MPMNFEWYGRCQKNVTKPFEIVDHLRRFFSTKPIAIS